MLLNNYSVLNSSPGRAIGQFTNLYSNYKPSSWYSYYIPDTIETTNPLKRASIYSGTEPPYTWILAPKGGELSCSNTLAGSSTLTAYMEADAMLASTLEGTSTLTAAMSIRIQLSATLAGTSTLTGSMSARIAMSATLAGTSTLTSGLSLTVKMASIMAGSSTLTANLKGVARLEAQIFVNQSQATVQEIAAGVWAEMLEGNVTAKQCMELLTAIAAGKTTIVDLGGGAATVTFRDINDTVDRVEAEMLNSERITVTKNL